jgi:hypothetical protein
VLLDKKCLPVMMEYFSAESKSTIDVIENHLRHCDAVILIAGARYGSSPPDNEKSYVEWEFEQAHDKGLPIVRLVMSPKARRCFPNIDEKERGRQEQFIKRLKGTHIKHFDESNFVREVMKAVDQLIKDLNKQQRAGFIKAAEHERSLDAKSYELYKSNTHGKCLRMLSSFVLLRQGSLDLVRKKEGAMKNGSDEREVRDKLLNLLHHDVLGQPVTAEIAANLMSLFIERLHGFSGPSGFTPDSMKELEVVLDQLFGDTLYLLEATSIHSTHKELASYKGYWEDSVLGPFFKKKNKEFLSRPGDHNIKRVYVCDSLADVLAEEWFNDTVIQHIRDGALVKIIQVNEKDVSSYEDFGLYEHNTGDAETYLLLAPKERNIQENELRTAVTADADKIGEYKKKFERMWGYSDQPLEIVQSAQLEEADRQPLTVHGEGAINELFEQRIILRKMQRLDNKESLLPEHSRPVRKYQQEYAKAVSGHINKRFPGVKHLFYVGDTYKNDGAAIRNLQALGWDVSGFICEPKLKIERLWFNSIFYTDRWNDLVGFAAKVREKVGPQSLALFDIDQTLWAPKGVHDSPLTRARTQAIEKLVDEYTDSDSETAKRAKARIELLYREISEVKYLNSLTLDNEDYKAAICVFLALNAIWNQQELESGDTDQGAAFFRRYHQLSPEQFLKYVKTEYLPRFLDTSQGGEMNMANFILRTLGVVKTNQFSRYGETNKIQVQSVQDDVERILREIMGTNPVKYQAFRIKELQESLSRTRGDGTFDDKLVLNKSAWDLASWLKQSGAQLLALSDRPDEATFIPDGESLLDAKMIIYGKSIIEILGAAPPS